VAFAHEIGMKWVNDDETPWCSIVMNYIAKKAGLKGSDKANARSWLSVGKPVSWSDATPGDVVVFWRGGVTGWQGHVGIFMGFGNNGTKVYCMGGNQGNEFNITALSTQRILAINNICEDVVKENVFSSLPLRKGHESDDVRKLQGMLELISFGALGEHGSYNYSKQSDHAGFFGSATFLAVVDFQKKNKLKPDGVFGRKTEAALSAKTQE